MTPTAKCPPYEIVTIEDASNAAVKRLRVYVAMRPEHAGDMARIATDVVGRHAANNDVVIMFFHFSAAVAGKTPAEARARYVRSGMKQGYVPAPLKSERPLSTVQLPNGVMTVEAPREPETTVVPQVEQQPETQQEA